MSPLALSHFLAVVDHRSLTGAANALGLSQSALTKSIKRLEATLGVELFERLPRGIALTRYGEILARQGRLADLELQRGLAEIEALGHGDAGTLRIGGTPVWTTTLLPKAAVEARKIKPNAHMTFSVDMPPVLIRQLRNDELDVAAMGIEEYQADPDLILESLGTIVQVVYARVGHPLAEKPDIEVEDLLSYPWVVFQNDPADVARLTNLSRKHNLAPPRIEAETSSIVVKMSLASNSEFLFCSSELLQNVALTFGVRPLPIEPLWQLPAGLIFRRAARNIPIANIFLNAFRRLYQADRS
ncbi:LysR family transcriptional regulator [Agrobacterium sp. ATCC 31749]|uniref:LysR family transcriptional regulator n=1 Tax=unclassified Agrobacterium TaxID=2632611 RepID=UPI00020DBE6A|nr:MULTISPECIES: LysR family transcriptional regulator [unclassified Agrobacterium]EGL62122.1 LysR family transcriptional regulator [Agrobacterium sp. ATCC 31749]QKX00477.1 LysR family transcriptional regulator [Agrobacterium sp. CGMCC 11546]